MPQSLDDARYFPSKQGGSTSNVHGGAQGQCLSMNRHYFKGVLHPTVDTVRQILKEQYTPADADRLARVIRPLFRIGSGRVDTYFDEVSESFKEQTLWRDRAYFLDDIDLLVDWLTYRVRRVRLHIRHLETNEEYEAQVHDFVVEACELALFIVRFTDMARLPNPIIEL